MTRVSSLTSLPAHAVFPFPPQFGVQATVDGAHSGEMAGVILSELQAVAKGAVSAEELSRAKTATVSSVLMNLESRAVVAEDIGRQILTYGERKVGERGLPPPPPFYSSLPARWMIRRSGNGNRLKTGASPSLPPFSAPAVPGQLRDGRELYHRRRPRRRRHEAHEDAAHLRARPLFV